MATVEQVSKNPLIGDNFFNANPDKVLGVQTIERGRFGNEVVKVKGTLDVIQKIDVPAVALVDLYPTQVFASESSQKIIDQVFEHEFEKQNEQRIEKIRSKGKRTKKDSSTQNLVASQEVYTFKEFSDLYNRDISRDEMEAYYFCNPDLDWRHLIDKFTNSKEELIEKGLICYDNAPDMRRWVYKYSYQAGNINKKIADLQSRKDDFISNYGEAQFDRQLQFLQEVKPKSKGLIGDDRLIILPHSAFAKSIYISELKAGPELSSTVSLLKAFKIWLREQPSDVFNRSNYVEIIDYYLDNKEIPINKNNKEQQVKDEKKAINIRQRSKEEGDALFAKFLANELLPEDQAKISYLWNEKFNGFAEPNLAKVPICLRISKTFKAGAQLLLNPTQRQAAAFMQEKRSGLLAYGVGVGKTISSILCMLQAYYNGFCKKPLFVVPTNTYDNWIAELQGRYDKETGKFIQGIAPHLPPVVGLFNLNPTIVQDKLKVYSEQDQKIFDGIEEAVNILRKHGPAKDIDRQTAVKVEKLADININSIRNDYNEKTFNGTFQVGRIDNLVDYVIKYLKDEYNANIYLLGKIRSFPEGTVFVTTENGLQRLGVSRANQDKMATSLYSILSQGDQFAETSQEKKNVAKLQEKIMQRVSKSMRNAMIEIEEIGIDWACLDEAHMYKRLFTLVKGDFEVDQPSEKKSDYRSSEDKKASRQKSKYEIKSGATPSNRALSAFLLTHFIQTMHDNRNVVLLTATPFTNSPLEVYSMLVLTNYTALVEMGLGNMVEFFDTFMKINYDIKYTPQKTVKKDVVLTGYNNLSNLRQIIYAIMDKKDEGANLKRPIKLMYPSLEKGIETTIPMTSEQESLIAQVKEYVNGKRELDMVCQQSLIDEIDEMDFDGLDDDGLIAEWEKYTGKEYDGDRDMLSDAKRDSLVNQIRTAIKKDTADGTEFSENDLDESESLGVRILRGISMMKQITLSPYLFHKACSKVQHQKYDLPNYRDFVETSPKLRYTIGCIKSVIDFHRSRNEKISGQVIYMTNGVEYFPLIKEYLVRELGLRDEQVGIVTGGMSRPAKENVKRRFLSGDILVLIGSSAISTGVNLQDNATVLYNLWYDWNPTDAAQIEGRIWRQGNRHQFVRIVYPQCFNSSDPVIFEYLNAKTLRINEIWNRSSEIQELDLRDFNPKELQKKLITDPVERADWEILEQIDKIEGEILYFENRRDLLAQAVQSYRNYQYSRPKAVKYLNEISAARASVKKSEAIARAKNRLAEISEKYSDDPEKLVAEINKYKKERYDHEGDPEGKYVPKTYDEADDETVYADAGKISQFLDEMDFRSQEKYGSIYDNRHNIQHDLISMRFDYKYMKSAEERVLRPMGIDFTTAVNPIDEFNQKLEDLRAQLELVESTREEKIKRYTIEYAQTLKTMKTVEQRIAEFAAANEKLLPPQIGEYIPEPEPVQEASVQIQPEPVSIEPEPEQEEIKAEEIVEQPEGKNIPPSELPMASIDEDFSEFVTIVNSSSSLKEAFEKARSIKGVPAQVVDKFTQKYNPDRDLSPFESFELFYNEVKSAGKEVIDASELVSEETKEQRFGLPEASTIEQLESNIFDILSQYRSRSMAAIQVEEYLSEKKELGKEYLDVYKIKDREQLKKHLAKLQLKGRSGKGLAKRAARKAIAEEKASIDVDNIEALALQAEDEMQERIAEQPALEEDTQIAIKNQIEGLTLAMEFADDKEREQISKQIEALELALNFI